MSNSTDSPKTPTALFDIQKRSEDHRTRCICDPGNTREVLNTSQGTLREAEERYCAFIALSTEGIWRLESKRPMPISMSEEDQIEFILKHAYFAECNDACARMYGLANAEELMGMRLTDIMPGSNPQNIEVIRDFIRSGYRLSDRATLEIDKEGNPRYITNNITGIVENNCLVRAWGMQRDVTNRKQAEEAINAEREQLLSIFGSINESIYISDIDTYEILYANEHLQKFFGKALIGELCYKALQGEDKPCDFCTNSIILKLNGQPYQWEFHNPIINKDFQIVDRMIHWPDGRDVRFEIAIDITSTSWPK